MFKHELVAVYTDVDSASRATQAVQVLEARVGCSEVVLCPGVVAEVIDTVAPIQEVVSNLAELVHVRDKALGILGRKIGQLQRVKATHWNGAQGSNQLRAQGAEGGHCVVVVSGVSGLLTLVPIRGHAGLNVDTS